MIPIAFIDCCKSNQILWNDLVIIHVQRYCRDPPWHQRMTLQDKRISFLMLLQHHHPLEAPRIATLLAALPSQCASSALWYYSYYPWRGRGRVHQAECPDTKSAITIPTKLIFSPLVVVSCRIVVTSSTFWELCRRESNKKYHHRQVKHFNSIQCHSVKKIQN